MCSDEEHFLTRSEDLYGSLNTYGKMENGEAVGGNPLSAQNTLEMQDFVNLSPLNAKCKSNRKYTFFSSSIAQNRSKIIAK